MLNQRTKATGANVPEAVELTRLGVSGAAVAIRRGEVSAENYVSALLAKARRDEGLRAFITLDEPGALSAAREADKARRQGAERAAARCSPRHQGQLPYGRLAHDAGRRCAQRLPAD